MLTKLSRDAQLDQEFMGRHRAERVLNAEVPYVRCLDRSDREDVRLHRPRCVNASAFGLRGYVDTLYCLVAMHLLDRSCEIVGKNFEILRSPTVASEPGLCVDVICTSRTQRVEGDNSHTTYHQRLTLI